VGAARIADAGERIDVENARAANRARNLGPAFSLSLGSDPSRFPYYALGPELVERPAGEMRYAKRRNIGQPVAGA
jgi:hypothetical protein